MNDDDSHRHRSSEDRQRDALLPAGSRAAAARAATSPQAVEATLASISNEVMEEAVARRDRDALLKGLKRS